MQIDRKIIFVLTLFFISITVNADFTETPQFGDRSSISIAWGDYDNDGDLDLAVGNENRNYLYINNGDGTFTEEEKFGRKFSHAVVWGDYDNDGDLDLAVGNQYDGQNYLFINNGDGTFTEEEQFGEDHTKALAWGDYDRDGDLDMAVGNYSNRQNYLYINNGDGTFTEVPQFGESYTVSVNWGDYDGDGDLDLAVGNYCNQQNYIYENQGDGSFVEIPQFETGDTYSIVWGDYDNDKDLDLALVNTDGGQNYLYINNSDGTFTGEPQFGERVTHTIACADYDNDSDLDISIGNYTGQKNYLYINNGDGTFTEQEQFGDGYTTETMAWGDYDSDGDLDLAVGNWNPRNYLYINNENDDDYLSIHLIGHYHNLGSGYSNRDGIGASIFVYEEGYIGDDTYLVGFREVEASGGLCGQDSLDAEFGIPDLTSVDILIIWPGSDGYHIKQQITGVNIPQMMTVEEDGELIPNKINLAEFSAVDKDGRAILLNWEVSATEGENISGFNLYRREMGQTDDTPSTPGGEDSYPRTDEHLDDGWSQINSSLITGSNPYTYIDETAERGITYRYRLEAVVDEEPQNIGNTTGVCGLPLSFEMTSIHPNPAKDSVSITLSTPESVEVRLEVYDIGGRLVKSKVIGEIGEGERTEVLEVSDLSSGVYTLKAITGVETSKKNMVVVR